MEFHIPIWAIVSCIIYTIYDLTVHITSTLYVLGIFKKIVRKECLKTSLVEIKCPHCSKEIYRVEEK